VLVLLKLRKKTAEVTKACEKHYALEQELAFYKIDHKFDSLSRPPVIHTPDSSGVSWQFRSVHESVKCHQRLWCRCFRCIYHEHINRSNMLLL